MDCKGGGGGSEIIYTWKVLEKMPVRLVLLLLSEFVGDRLKNCYHASTLCKLQGHENVASEIQ